MRQFPSLSLCILKRMLKNALVCHPESAIFLADEGSVVGERKRQNADSSSLRSFLRAKAPLAVAFGA
jgi:hypothetical protein